MGTQTVVVFLAFTLAFLVQQAASKVTEADSCAASGDVASTAKAKAVSSQDDATGLLQHQRVAQHERVLRTAQTQKRMFAQLEAAVRMEQLRLAVLNKAEGEGSRSLQEEKLVELRRAFPQAEALKEHFAAEWKSISKAVDLEKVREELEATGRGLEASQLEGQLAAMRAKAAETWSLLQTREVALPDLGSLTPAAEKILDTAGGLLGSALNSTYGQAAQDAVGSLTSAALNTSYGQTAENLTSSIATEGLESPYVHAAQDAVGGLANAALNTSYGQAAQDAVGGLASAALNTSYGQAAQDVASSVVAEGFDSPYVHAAQDTVSSMASSAQSAVGGFFGMA